MGEGGVFQLGGMGTAGVSHVLKFIFFFFFFFAVFCKLEIKILVSRNYQELDTFRYINTILEVQNNDNCILSYVRFEA